jgi:hypothetical protein
VQLFWVNGAGCYDPRVPLSPALTVLLERRGPTLAFTGTGISAMVYPAAELLRMAQAAGAYVVGINPEDERLPGLAGEIVPELMRVLSADVGSQR